MQNNRDFPLSRLRDRINNKKLSATANLCGELLFYEMPDQVGHDCNVIAGLTGNQLPVKNLLEVVSLRVLDSESLNCLVVVLSYVVSDVLVVVL